MSRSVQAHSASPLRRQSPPGSVATRFTLLEVLVAITLLMLIMGVMVGFGREMARSWAKLSGEHGRFRELLALDRTVDNLLGGAVPFMWPNADGEAALFFTGEAEYMRLACLHPVSQADEGALRFAEVFVEDGVLRVSYTDRPYREPEEAQGRLHTSVLAEGVDRVSFAYADWSADESGEWDSRLLWVDEWDPERQELPLAVMLTVHWEDGRVESWLRRTAAAGYRERWGRWEPAKSQE